MALNIEFNSDIEMTYYRLFFQIEVLFLVVSIVYSFAIARFAALECANICESSANRFIDK